MDNTTKVLLAGAAAMAAVVGGLYVLETAKAKSQTTTATTTTTQASLTLSAAATNIDVGVPDTFTVTASGIPDGTPVTLWVLYGGNNWTQVDTQTLSGGQATFSYTPSLAGTYYFQATANVGGSS
ncbi:MAG: hypothetical protein RXR31_03415 [Thermoproteota archaeon]